jgi:hypothetical protein
VDLSGHLLLHTTADYCRLEFDGTTEVFASIIGTLFEMGQPVQSYVVFQQLSMESNFPNR